MLTEENKIADLIRQAVAAANSVDHPRPECLLEWRQINAPLENQLISINNQLANISVVLSELRGHERRIIDLERNWEGISRGIKWLWTAAGGFAIYIGYKVIDSLSIGLKP